MINVDTFLIVSKERRCLSLGMRIFIVALCILFTYFSLMDFQLNKIPTLVLAALGLGYIFTGKTLFRTKCSLRITENRITIKRFFHKKVRINIHQVKCLVLNYNEFQVHYSDFVKTYDVSWLSNDEYQKLEEKIKVLNATFSHNDPSAQSPF